MKSRLFVAALVLACACTSAHASQQYVFEKGDVLTRAKLTAILDVEHAGEALLGVGVILEQEGRPAEAEQWLVRAIRNNPGDPLTIVSFVDAARWLRKGGKPGDAIALLNKGLSHAPAERSLLAELADVSAEAGEKAKAAGIERLLKAH